MEDNIIETDDDEGILAEGREAFDLCVDADSDNRNLQREDLRFTKLREQWPADVINQRQLEGRPCLTLDKTQAFTRQVVNEIRLNKPQIKVKPVDGGADPETAEIYSGLIRNIEYSSDADVARDTAADFAVSSGRGYYRVNTKYTSDDTFDQDIIIERIANPLAVFGDPYSTAADSSDWNVCFVTDMLSPAAFRKRFPDADAVDWDTYCAGMSEAWFDGDSVMVAEYWKREEIPAQALMLSDGSVIRDDIYEQHPDQFIDPETGLPLEILASRPVRRFKVTCYVLSGAEVLEKTDWPGSYIPIIPVYGDEINVDGRRWFSSLIRPVIDAQRNYNYWRSAATELVALAPKTPFIGPEEAFIGEDAAKWENANNASYSFISYKGNQAPQRQPYAGIPAGALQEALNANDDMKSILGIYDASLGARSNETSGVAINARKQEGDVSTFHFIDNLSRAMKHEGRILLDLIPHVYNSARVIRVLGPEGEPESVRIGDAESIQRAQMEAANQLEEIDRIYDLSTGKYDVAVETGPSFTTQRQEANAAILEIIRAVPGSAEILAPLALKTFDIPGIDDALELIEQQKAMQAQGQGPDPAEMAKTQAELQTKQAELQLKAQESQEKAALEREKLALDGYKAETDRMKVVHDLQQPTRLPTMAM